MERRLAAVLAADVVGYSRLMEADEAGTLAALKSHREDLIDPEIAEHYGRIVKLMGDGALVEFASVVDAVACAAEIQRGMAARNRGVDEIERIEVELLRATTKPTERDIDGHKGVLAWTDTYEPNEERTIKFGYAVTHPEDQTVSGFYRSSEAGPPGRPLVGGRGGPIGNSGSGRRPEPLI